MEITSEKTTFRIYFEELCPTDIIIILIGFYDCNFFLRRVIPNLRNLNHRTISEILDHIWGDDPFDGSFCGSCRDERTNNKPAIAVDRASIEKFKLALVRISTAQRLLGIFGYNV